MSETRAFIISLCCMKYVHYSKHMLHKQDCINFHGRIAWQSFSENNFDDFSDVVQLKKKSQDFVQPLVAFPISNISYCCLLRLPYTASLDMTSRLNPGGGYSVQKILQGFQTNSHPGCAEIWVAKINLLVYQWHVPLVYAKFGKWMGPFFKFFKIWAKIGSNFLKKIE